MSAITTLRERITYYENLSNYKLMNGLPKIIIINGRNFRKITSLFKKPFSEEFLQLMAGTTVKLMSEIEGAKFAYSFNDIIVIGVNSLTEQWYDGDIQKISSSSSSIATFEFNKLSKDIELFGDAIFSSYVFNVPNINELINVFILQQQSAFHTSLTLSCYYELMKKFDTETIKQTLMDKSATEKAEVLYETCGIDFNGYPMPYRRGFAVYRAPKMVADEIKSKLTVNFELPLFTKDQDFLNTIFKSGKDILRVK